LTVLHADKVLKITAKAVAQTKKHRIRLAIPIARVLSVFRRRSGGVYSPSIRNASKFSQVKDSPSRSFISVWL
jgi:hypothetical protein